MANTLNMDQITVVRPSPWAYNPQNIGADDNDYGPGSDPSGADTDGDPNDIRDGKM